MPTVTVHYKGSDSPWVLAGEGALVQTTEHAALTAMQIGSTFDLGRLGVTIPGADILAVEFSEEG